jgi:DNA-binding response OmpR family regulator
MRLLVVEDNAKLAALLTKLLGDRAYAVDNVASIEEARAALGTAKYDLILLDLALPDGDGREILRALRGSGRGVPVLVATARADVTQRVKALDEGADDYLVKPFSLDELLARVRALLRRPPQTMKTILASGNVTLDTASLALAVGGQAIEAPRRELSVLTVLLRNEGRLVTRGKLEEAIYSFDDEVTPNAMEAAVSRLRRRLEAHGASVTVTAMRGLGYVLADRPPC